MAERKSRSGLNMEKIMNFLNYLVVEKPQVSILIPVVVAAWLIERWVFSFSSWLPLVVAVWATMQYGSYQQKITVEDLNKEWKRNIFDTAVVHKTLYPQWKQTLEFPDDGSSLILHVKDHYGLLPTSSLGVKRGEIHNQIIRKVPELETGQNLDSKSSSNKSRQISCQMKQMMIRLQPLVENEDLEEISMALIELERLEDLQEEYVLQLETEQKLLLEKIQELGEEMLNAFQT